MQLDDNRLAERVAKTLLDQGAAGHALGDGGRDSALHAAVAKFAKVRYAKEEDKKQGLGLVTTLCKQQVKQIQSSASVLDFCTFECQVRTATRAVCI